MRASVSGAGPQRQGASPLQPYSVLARKLGFPPKGLRQAAPPPTEWERNEGHLLDLPLLPLQGAPNTIPFQVSALLP